MPISREQQTQKLREQFDGIVAKLRAEFDDGPTGVTLAAGEGALLFRILLDAGIVRR